MNLKLTKTKLAALRRKNIKNCVGGSEARYIQITVNVGVKLFECLKTRNYSHKNQQYAFVNGFGPAVGPRFTITLEGEKFYCYITQHALPFSDNLQFHYGRKQDLMNTLRKHGWSLDDIYPDGDRNLGFCRDKMVCIDFGPLTREGIYLE